MSEHILKSIQKAMVTLGLEYNKNTANLKNVM